MPKPRVSVVIPALNEAANLSRVFAHLPSDVFEVILVDGDSSDNTVEVARALYPGLRVVAQTRRGKGNALQCGFATCRGDIIVTIDADGSMMGYDINRFVDVLCQGADFAKGSRFLPGGGSADFTHIRRWGNWILLCLVNFLYRTTYSDITYGFNAFWIKYLPIVMTDCDTFAFEILVNCRIARAGLRVVEVPSFEARRHYGRSKLRIFRDGWAVLIAVVRERLRYEIEEMEQADNDPTIEERALT